jgi:hypothetical protein
MPYRKQNPRLKTVIIKNNGVNLSIKATAEPEIPINPRIAYPRTASSGKTGDTACTTTASCHKCK